MKLLQSIYIPGQPSSVTAQQKGVTMIAGRPHFYEKAKVSQAKRDLLNQLKPYIPDHPYLGPLRIEVLWLFEKKSLPKSKNNTFKTERPDSDNLFKSLADIMNRFFYLDDSHLTQVSLTKGWSNKDPGPGLYIKLYQLEPEDFTKTLEDFQK